MVIFNYRKRHIPQDKNQYHPYDDELVKLSTVDCMQDLVDILKEPRAVLRVNEVVDTSGFKQSTHYNEDGLWSRLRTSTHIDKGMENHVLAGASIFSKTAQILALDFDDDLELNTVEKVKAKMLELFPLATSYIITTSYSHTENPKEKGHKWHIYIPLEVSIDTLHIKSLSSGEWSRPKSL